MNDQEWEKHRLARRQQLADTLIEFGYTSQDRGVEEYWQRSLWECPRWGTPAVSLSNEGACIPGWGGVCLDDYTLRDILFRERLILRRRGDLDLRGLITFADSKYDEVLALFHFDEYKRTNWGTFPRIHWRSSVFHRIVSEIEITTGCAVMEGLPVGYGYRVYASGNALAAELRRELLAADPSCFDVPGARQALATIRRQEHF